MLWVDALCINQDDPEERGEQVVNMASIYRTAEAVIAWLGESDSGTKIVMETFERWASRWKEGTLDISTDAKGAQNFFDVTQEELSTIQAFGNRPHWTPIWILQELALAQTITFHCGNTSMSYTTLCDGLRAWSQTCISLFQTDPAEFAYHARIQVSSMGDMLGVLIDISGGDDAAAVTTIGKGNRPLRDHSQPWVFSTETMSLSRYFSATDARDRVYALYGLMTDIPYSISTPNYRKT